MQKLGAQLDWKRHTALPMRVDSPADAIASFEHHAAHASRSQPVGGGKTGRTGADDHDIRFDIQHFKMLTERQLRIRVSSTFERMLERAMADVAEKKSSRACR